MDMASKAPKPGQVDSPETMGDCADIFSLLEHKMSRGTHPRRFSRPFRLRVAQIPPEPDDEHKQQRTVETNLVKIGWRPSLVGWRLLQLFWPRCPSAVLARLALRCHLTATRCQRDSPLRPRWGTGTAEGLVATTEPTHLQDHHGSLRRSRRSLQDMPAIVYKYLHVHVEFISSHIFT